MAAFGADGRCLMRALQEELDDPEPARLRALLGVRRRRASTGRSTRSSCAPPRCTCARKPLLLEVKKMAPARGRRDAQDPRGRAGGGGPRARAARRRRLGPARAGRPPRRALRRRAGRGRRRGRARLGRAGRLGDRRAVAAQRAARCPTSRRGSPSALGLPYEAALERTGDGPPQREMANSAQQVANVRGQFAVAGDAARPARACSSTTCASAAGRSPWSPASCAAAAPAPVYPLALATAF